MMHNLSPDWEPLYEAALLETDDSKLPERIFAAACTQE
jgi:hypothetical protein